MTNSRFYIKRVFFIIVIICSTTFSFAQKNPPKNYFGLSGFMGLSRLSVGCGFEYERWLLTKKQWAVGTNINLVFPSKTLPGIFATQTIFERNSQIQVMANSYFFTNAEKETKGFFLSFGTGVSFIEWEIQEYDESGNSVIQPLSEASSGFDFSLGSQSKGKRIATRISAGYQIFNCDKFQDATIGHGVSLIYFKVWIGF